MGLRWQGGAAVLRSYENSACTFAKQSAYGRVWSMYSLMRRTDTLTRAPIFRSFSLREAAVALARRVPARASLRALLSSDATADSLSLRRLVAKVAAEVRSLNRSSCSGMIVGEHVRSGDLKVNVSKGKKFTNMRAGAADENVRLEPPRRLTLELALEFINDDELIEVTPDAIRPRKRLLDATARKKAGRRAAARARGE